MRESAQSWPELLVDVKRRGLAIAPEIPAGDGALGFWKSPRRVPTPQPSATAKLMVFTLVMAAANTWWRLKVENPLPKVVAGVTAKDGTEVIDLPAVRAV